MFDQLINLVKENAGDDIVKNPAIPDQYNEEAIRETGDEIRHGFEQEAQQGNFGNIVSMFKGTEGGGLTSNPMTRNIISNLATKFASKFGISPEIANSIAAGLVPKVLNQFINKTNDPNDNSFDLQDVLKKFTGKSDIGDLIGQFTGGSSKTGAGGLGETIGGFFDQKK